MSQNGSRKVSTEPCRGPRNGLICGEVGAKPGASKSACPKSGSAGGAFTVVEMAVILLFVAIMAFVAVPRLQFAGLRRQQADAVARSLVTDLRLTRVLAVNHAVTNVVGFGLNMTGAEPYSGYDIVNLDTGETIDSHTIDAEIECTGGRNFSFGPLGNLLGGSDNRLFVSSADRSFTITVITATGAVRCVEE